MKAPQSASRVEGKLVQLQEGKLVIEGKEGTTSVPAGFDVSVGFLNEWLGKQVRVLIVDGVAAYMERSKGPVTKIKYPKEV